jgi:hypothetical protein
LEKYYNISTNQEKELEGKLSLQIGFSYCLHGSAIFTGKVYIWIQDARSEIVLP